MYNFSRKPKSQKINTNNTVSIGKLGEDAALEMLKKKGFKCLERNYRFSHSEIDLIVEDKTRIVFVEVKARTYKDNNIMPYGRPARAVNYEKRQHILSAAKNYLRTHDTGEKLIRIDVVEVYFAFSPEYSNSKEVTKIVHIENAFGA